MYDYLCPEMSIRCGRLVHFRSKEENKKHPIIPGYININVTSGNSKWRALSPMKLGPFEHTEVLHITEDYPDGVLPGFTLLDQNTQIAIITNLESLWQYSKVHDIDIDNATDNIKSSFFERRARGIQDPKPHRRVFPKSLGHKVVGAYWNGELINYIESRYWYCTLYTRLVKARREYQDLLQLKEAGTNLHIIGYDGRDTEISIENMKLLYKDESAPFGHELVLCCLLNESDNWQPWLLE